MRTGALHSTAQLGDGGDSALSLSCTSSHSPHRTGSIPCSEGPSCHAKAGQPHTTDPAAMQRCIPTASALELKRARAHISSKAGHVTQPNCSSRAALRARILLPNQPADKAEQAVPSLSQVLHNHSSVGLLKTTGVLLGLSPAPHAPDDVCVLPILPFALLPLAVHHRGIHIGWRKRVGFIQQ